MGVGMATTNLFGHPAFKDGAFTSNDRGVRRAAIGKAMRAIDLGGAAGTPRCSCSGAAARAPRCGTAKDPRDALERYREAIDVLAGLLGRAGLSTCASRSSPSPTSRAATSSCRPSATRCTSSPRSARPEHGRRQPRGRARDDGRAVVPPRRRAGAVGGQAVPHRPQRPADRPLRPGLPLRRARTSRRPSTSCGCSSARATTGRGTSTRTPTATRTPRACGTSRAAAWRTYRALAEAARALRRADPEVQEALAAASVAELGEPTVGDGDDPDDAEGRGRRGSTRWPTRGYDNERLDQLVVEVLLGVAMSVARRPRRRHERRQGARRLRDRRGARRAPRSATRSRRRGPAGPSRTRTDWWRATERGARGAGASRTSPGSG